LEALSTWRRILCSAAQSCEALQQLQLPTAASSCHCRVRFHVPPPKKKKAKKNFLFQEEDLSKVF